MIVSEKGGFVLLMNPKTGTTALTQALRPWTSLSAQRTPAEKHMDYATFRALHGDLVAAYDVYCVVRPPLETLQSWYRYRSRSELAGRDHPRHINYTGGITFDQFLVEWGSDSPPSRAAVGAGSDFVLDSHGRIAPIRIFRHASLGALAAELSERVGSRLTVPRVNVSPDVPASAELSPEARSARLDAALTLYQSIIFAA